jgi:hypothetical protein
MNLITLIRPLNSFRNYVRSLSTNSFRNCSYSCKDYEDCASIYYTHGVCCAWCDSPYIESIGILSPVPMVYEINVTTKSKDVDVTIVNSPNTIN